MEINFKQGDANWITELPREDFPLLPELEELKTVISKIGPDPASIEVPPKENPSILAIPWFSLPEIDQSPGTLSVADKLDNTKLSGISSIEN